jgi:hypothetical protein
MGIKEELDVLNKEMDEFEAKNPYIEVETESKKETKIIQYELNPNFSHIKTELAKVINSRKLTYDQIYDYYSGRRTDALNKINSFRNTPDITTASLEIWLDLLGLDILFVPKQEEK